MEEQGSVILQSPFWGGWANCVDGLSTTDSGGIVARTDWVGLLMVGRNLKSSTTECFSLGFWTGRNFRRNFLLHKELHPDPSIQTTYWSNCQISTIQLVLSHFIGWGPVWFWTSTWSPTQSGGNCLVCCVHTLQSKLFWSTNKVCEKETNQTLCYKLYFSRDKLFLK